MYTFAGSRYCGTFGGRGGGGGGGRGIAAQASGLQIVQGVDSNDHVGNAVFRI